MKTYFIVAIFAWIAIALSGCGKQTYNTEFIEINGTLTLPNHIKFCKDNPSDMFCTKTESLDQRRPTRDEAYWIGRVMANNLKYKFTGPWYYNDRVNQSLKGDCTNAMLTIVRQMYLDGFDLKYIYLVTRFTSETESHQFVAVDTPQGMIHIDAEEGNGKPIEEHINFYMKMTNPGADKWINGDIKIIDDRQE